MHEQLTLLDIRKGEYCPLNIRGSYSQRTKDEVVCWLVVTSIRLLRIMQRRRGYLGRLKHNCTRCSDCRRSLCLGLVTWAAFGRAMLFCTTTGIRCSETKLYPNEIDPHRCLIPLNPLSPERSLSFAAAHRIPQPSPPPSTPASQLAGHPSASAFSSLVDFTAHTALPCSDHPLRANPSAVPCRPAPTTNQPDRAWLLLVHELLRGTEGSPCRR
jgi:hypothetical protein